MGTPSFEDVVHENQNMAGQTVYYTPLFQSCVWLFFLYKSEDVFDLKYPNPAYQNAPKEAPFESNNALY